MTKNIISFSSILLASLVVGSMFGIWIGFNPADLSPSTYVEQQQSMIRQLNVLMPLLGLVTIIVTSVSAFLHKQNKIRFISLLVAILLLIVSGVITRFGNQPINDIVMTWTPATPPGNWIDHRDKWWSLHITRTVSALSAFCIIIMVNLRNSKNIQYHSHESSKS